uniref:LRAT domain containing 1 n=1 Tax=Astyanax mexicanus TaxID=7994 RepID=A0A8B9RD39_ASTMX
MGNQLDRITHLNYSELPTGDPSGVEKDELRVGVAYFFSDDEEEPDDRSPSDSFRDDSPSGGGYSAFCCHECIFSKLRASEDLRVHSPTALLSMCKPGDVLELVARAQPPHWAVYAGGERVVHLHKGEIRADSLLDASGGRPGRIVNERYRYRPLPAELVVRNAAGHVGLRGGEVCWGDSESFAAWCRFGKREFKAGGEAHSAEQRYFLKVHAAHSPVRTLVFRSLEDMIRERRRVDASGLLHELRKQTNKQKGSEI